MKLDISKWKPKDKGCTVKSPWMIEEISNGLKARSVKMLNGTVIKTNKKIGVQYFEYDRIYGRNAFCSVLKVLEMFDELKDITPQTIGYIFNEHIYLYHNRGILKRDNRTQREDYFSEETLRNKGLADYFHLTHDDPIEEAADEVDPDRTEIHNPDTSIQAIQGSREL